MVGNTRAARESATRSADHLSWAAAEIQYYLAIPAARLGLGYGYASLRQLVGLVGPTSAKEILFTARRFSADEALAMGLVNRVVPKAALDAYVGDYARRIAENAPLTVQACKAIVDQIMADPHDRDLEHCQALVEGCFALVVLVPPAFALVFGQA